MPEACRVPGCTDSATSRGLCARHYRRWRTDWLLPVSCGVVLLGCLVLRGIPGAIQALVIYWVMGLAQVALARTSGSRPVRILSLGVGGYWAIAGSILTASGKNLLWNRGSFLFLALVPMLLTVLSCAAGDVTTRTGRTWLFAGAGSGASLSLVPLAAVVTPRVSLGQAGAIEWFGYYILAIAVISIGFGIALSKQDLPPRPDPRMVDAWGRFISGERGSMRRTK